ncbi:MAG: hypothetical protein A2Z14_17485 [Chloroflexi bacterium RBG_16_48_8]|nr:MAG: hypothetical protein A2Z14_17485 [Chloroflexi bacterium RBG_16_48_8]
MSIRRIIVWIISSIFGIISASVTLRIFSKSTSHLPFISTILIFLTFSSLAFIWLDFFFKTKYVA